MYSLARYGEMIADEIRTGAYAHALERAVRPGSTVLDIGAGSGIMSLLACQYGARKVYAIEPDEIIEVARELARENGFADRIEFIREISTKVTLPERVDVIVADLRGVLPLFGSHLTSLADARERFLAEGGVMIPRRDTLWACVVESSAAVQDLLGAWTNAKRGLAFDAARRYATNTWTRTRVNPENLLAEAQRWAEIDYAQPLPANRKGSLDFHIARRGTGHGLALWFDTELAEGIGYSNAPGRPKLIYGMAFFPWPADVPLEDGDRVSVNLRADLVGEDYVWSWESRVSAPAGELKAEFRQSSFMGKPLSPESLRRVADSFRPALGEDGEIDRLVLGLMNGERSLGEIARELAERFPERFPSARAALTRAGELSEKYSRRS
jgi:protein arginine N-methyltransferase 1